eukprot:CAMPEP_0197013676 /NCGR_PEP_ID=MMETSP1380-20130617/67242_1 /TAXON_ID=5936 /ORGANISM="Euplotes crassus, Strain CT5" /LENGTH=208 /DNA_ID=CAMNT_0042438105 /DNA_START=24 /DNA_END=648 /DNA_ORIENTATION=+
MISDGPFSKLIIVDGKGHLLGRLASIVAKQLLQGQRITVVRCEELEVSGSLIRNKFKFMAFLRKHVTSNHRRGPFHHRSPSQMFLRTVRGMIPHKTKRGTLAMQRLRVYEGCPPPFDKSKKLVVPQALRVIRLRPGRVTARLGDVAQQVGWKYNDVIKALEEKRRARGKIYIERKKAILKARAKTASTIQTEELKAVKESLSQLGYKR